HLKLIYCKTICHPSFFGTKTLNNIRLQNDRCQNSSVIDPSSVITPAFTPNRLTNTNQEFRTTIPNHRT
ncbi:hypothetical protein, partial [Macellibacteroides fermentans]|uniref:hypothetical protein n=1 Tax=Macellibacteroides fermentans TaxID=879969 RepID=UPI00406CB125